MYTDRQRTSLFVSVLYPCLIHPPPSIGPVILYNHFLVPSPLRLLYHMSLFRHAAKYPYRGRHLSAYNIPVMLTSTTFSTDVSDLGFKVIGTFPNWPIFFPLLTAPPSFCSFASQYCFKGRSTQPPSAGLGIGRT